MIGATTDTGPAPSAAYSSSVPMPLQIPVSANHSRPGHRRPAR